MVDHSVLQHLGNWVYFITERGEAYPDGELDTGEDTPDKPYDVWNGDDNGTATDEAR